MEDVRDKPGEKIVIGDINAKSIIWGSPITDKRGEYWCEWLATLNMYIVNDGEKPTFIRGQTESYIDITCATPNIHKKIRNWEVVEEETLTEHQYISFSIQTKDKAQTSGKSKSECDWEVFKDLVKWRTTTKIETIEELEGVLTDAYHCSVRKQESTATPFWWNNEIGEKRKECLRLKRLITRMNRRTPRDENGVEEARGDLKRNRKDLQSLIYKSKNRHWDDLCKELEEDIWGKGYKIVVKKLVGYAPYNISVEQKVKVAKELFPGRENEKRNRKSGEKPDPFSEEELRNVLRKMKSGKAPGLDGIPMEAIKTMEEILPSGMLNPMNNLLMQKRYPKKWKKARLVLIPKGDPKQMKFRPICLLSCISKVYEGLLRERLVKEIEINGDFSENQFGFRKGRSCIQAVEKAINTVKENKGDKWAAIITIDVKNAFNTVSWDRIMHKLEEKQIPNYLIEIVDQYLDQRQIQIDTGVCMEVTAGVPQGSVLGPTLWNILYDDLLDLQVPKGVTLLAYADDLAIVITGRKKEDLNWKGEEALNQISAWMKLNELEVAPHKSEAVILRGNREQQTAKFLWEGVEIPRKKSLVYLEVTIEEGCRFGQHLKTAVQKAERKIAALTRITPRIKGPGSKKRVMLYNVVQSILLYAAPVWHEYISMKRYRNLFIKTQRKMLLRVTTAYRTTSARAVQMVAGVIPIDLMTEERWRLHTREDRCTIQAKEEERSTTIDKWQELWENTLDTAQWTKRLIPNIREWIKCTHRTTDYFLTQVLTGHGSFRTYVKRIGKIDNDQCTYCGDVDTVEHTLFVCSKWVRERTQLYISVDRHLTAENLIETMIADKSNWSQIHTFVKAIMKIKETDEREQENRI